MHLERITLILEIVGQTQNASVADICLHSGLPKPTVYRLVQDLVATGLLEQRERGRFAVGARLVRITRSDHSDRALLEVIAPRLKQAATDRGASFFVSRLRGRSVEIIHVETPETGVSYLHPGLGKRPLHACSCSKAVAAFAPDLLSHASLQGRLNAYTEFTLTNLADLEAEFRSIRRRGYAECVEEIERGMCSVAAPLCTTGPGATVSIGAAGSSRVLTEPVRDEIGRLLKDMSRDISSTLGWNAQETPQKTA